MDVNLVPKSYVSFGVSLYMDLFYLSALELKTYTLPNKEFKHTIFFPVYKMTKYGWKLVPNSYS